MDGAPLPTGLVFSSFMLAMSIGGIVSDILLSLFSSSETTVSIISIATYLIAALSMYTAAVSTHFWYIFLSFLVLEAMVGMFSAVSGNLRSIVYPQQFQASIMSIFRIPLNFLVVIGTNLADSASAAASSNGHLSYSFVFFVLLSLHLGAAALQTIMHVSIQQKKQKAE